MNKKIISFSLWGQNSKYTIGAIKNADLSAKIYPGWICRFYYFQCVPFPIINELSKRENVELVFIPGFGDWKGLFERFTAIDDKEVSIMIVRDTDSRLNEREKLAVDEWMGSGKILHVMRDHNYHRFPILGGMWGIKKAFSQSIKELIMNFNAQNKYGTDYEFLGNVLFPLLKNNSFVHDEFFDGKCFPTKRIGLEFVGQVFDENDNTVQEHQEVLKNYLIFNGKYFE